MNLVNEVKSTIDLERASTVFSEVSIGWFRPTPAGGLLTIAALPAVRICEPLMHSRARMT